MIGQIPHSLFSPTQGCSGTCTWVWNTHARSTHGYILDLKPLYPLDVATKPDRVVGTKILAGLLVPLLKRLDLLLLTRDGGTKSSINRAVLWS